MGIYDTLNREQKEAVMHTEGPVLILAGAGSGKTSVITHRITYLMEECGVNPWNILAITFTNKAAGEMRERVDKMVGYGSESIWISTFHSMCVRILRRHIELLGYDNNFTIYDTDDQKTLMKDICKRLQIDTKVIKERAILSTISSAKNELIGPVGYRRDYGNEDFYSKKIADCYDEYQRMLRKNNALDFDDLLMLTVQLFDTHDEVLANYQNRFRYIMVDEYQDTNTAQFEIVRMLADMNKNICVVGDDDQSIYKFRGANIRNILDFEKVYPNAFVVKLEQNYRSSQTILNAANAVIGHNTKRKTKALWTDRGDGGKIHFRQFDTALDEAAFISGDIRKKVEGEFKNRYSDFAILYRTNAQARVLEERFVMEGIPYNVVGGTNFYDRREIRDMLAYLKTIDNGQDEIACRRIINVPRRGIGQTSIGRIAEYALSKDITFYEAMEHAKEIPSMGRGASKIATFTELIAECRLFAQGHTLEDLIRHVVEVIDYQQYLMDMDDENAEDRINNIDELVSKMVDYETTAEEPSLSGFLEEVALVADIDSMEESSDRVLLMTLHSAKGLEFPHVYLSGMEDGIFPSAMALSSGDSDDEEEERRLAYVGITRAREDLTLTASRTRMLRGEVQYNPVSRFVYEIPKDLFDSPVYKKKPRDYDFGGYDDDAPPFAEASRGYGSGGYTSGGNYSTGGYTSGGNYSTGGYSSGGSYGSSAGAGRGSATGGAGAAGTGSTRPRLKALGNGRKKTAEEKMPYLARSANSKQKALSSLGKGMPTAAAAPDYGVGDRVEHIKYGSGTVKAIEKGPKDYKVTVTFDEYGQKIMYAGFAKLRKN